MPVIDDYYEPWTYDYSFLTDAPLSDGPPVIRAHSRLTGRPMDLKQGPNWDDNLAGVDTDADPSARGLEEQVRLRYQNVFMFYLPRICNHCLNPSCVASCPSGALYKREQDGIVLVDQNTCRGWRFCVSGCPYKKVYFNHITTKAEKCIFCYAGVTEDGRPTVCSSTCVGRIRYVGVVLYDLDAVTGAAEAPAEPDLVEAQRSLLLDPADPAVVAGAQAAGIPHGWLQAARRSPAYALAKEFRVALPLHPECRTLPMVWYVPPLSPVLDSLRATGYGADDAHEVFGVVGDLRIPIDYVANILAAGERRHVEEALERLTAMRAYKRGAELTGRGDASLAAAAGMTPEQLERMYRLLAIAAYEERYVVPKAHREADGALQSHLRGMGVEEGQS
jgi:nitrate reductase beta subunit